jgi:hypothetical protein
MNWLQIINTLVVIIGIPTIVNTLLSMGGKLKTLSDIEEDIKTNIKPDLKDIREKFFAFEGKASGFFQTASPIKLTPVGEGILNDSGLSIYLDKNKETIISSCDEERDMQTSYDVQEGVFEFFDRYEFPKETGDKLKTFAFNKGISMDFIRRVGAIYFRQFCLEKHGLKEEDLDKPNDQTTISQ